MPDALSFSPVTTGPPANGAGLGAMATLGDDFDQLLAGLDQAVAVGAGPGKALAPVLDGSGLAAGGAMPLSEILTGFDPQPPPSTLGAPSTPDTLSAPGAPGQAAGSQVSDAPPGPITLTGPDPQTASATPGVLPASISGLGIGSHLALAASGASPDIVQAAASPIVFSPGSVASPPSGALSSTSSSSGGPLTGLPDPSAATAQQTLPAGQPVAVRELTAGKRASVDPSVVEAPQTAAPASPPMAAVPTTPAAPSQAQSRAEPAKKASAGPDGPSFSADTDGSRVTAPTYVAPAPPTPLTPIAIPRAPAPGDSSATVQTQSALGPSSAASRLPDTTVQASTDMPEAVAAPGQAAAQAPITPRAAAAAPFAVSGPGRAADPATVTASGSGPVATPASAAATPSAPAEAQPAGQAASASSSSPTAFEPHVTPAALATAAQANSDAGPLVSTLSSPAPTPPGTSSLQPKTPSLANPVQTSATAPPSPANSVPAALASVSTTGLTSLVASTSDAVPVQTAQSDVSDVQSSGSTAPAAAAGSTTAPPPSAQAVLVQPFAQRTTAFRSPQKTARLGDDAVQPVAAFSPSRAPLGRDSLSGPGASVTNGTDSPAQTASEPSSQDADTTTDNSDSTAAPDSAPVSLPFAPSGATTASSPGEAPPQVSSQTVADLAAQMAPKLEARTSRFDLQLDPAGLGRVNVSVRIGPNGRLTADLDFERPQSAADLGARADELQSALAQAGFDLTGGGLRFVTHGTSAETSSQAAANASAGSWNLGGQAGGFGGGSGQSSNAGDNAGGRQARMLLSGVSPDGGLTASIERSLYATRAVDVRI